MSLKVSKRVWRFSRSHGGARLALLGLADFADDHGRCYPGQALLATMCNTSVRSIYAGLKQLQALGEVTILPYQSRYGGHVYQITLPEETSTVEETSSRQGGDLERPEDSGVPTGSSCTTTGRFTSNDRKRSSDKPSEPLENHHEPSGARALASPQGKRREAPVPMPDEVRERLKGSRYGEDILKLGERQAVNGSRKVQPSAKGNPS